MYLGLFIMFSEINKACKIKSWFHLITKCKKFKVVVRQWHNGYWRAVDGSGLEKGDTEQYIPS